jgi:hypothetical protein
MYLSRQVKSYAEVLGNQFRVAVFIFQSLKPSYKVDGFHPYLTLKEIKVSLPKTTQLVSSTEIQAQAYLCLEEGG